MPSFFSLSNRKSSLIICNRYKFFIISKLLRTIECGPTASFRSGSNFRMSGSDLFESSEKSLQETTVHCKDDAERENLHQSGRQIPVHGALGGGKPADVILWRNKQISAALLAGASVIWLLFERIGYHLITFICHSLILSLTSLFIWSNLSFFVTKSPIKLPKVALREDLCMRVALLLRDACNKGVCMFRAVAYGKDVKKLVSAILGLWLVSVVSSCFDFLTLVYIIFVMLQTTPLLYEKNQDQVDSYAQKAKDKLKKQYSNLDEKVLQKLPFVSEKKQE